MNEKITIEDIEYPVEFTIPLNKNQNPLIFNLVGETITGEFKKVTMYGWVNLQNNPLQLKKLIRKINFIKTSEVDFKL